MPPPVGLRTDLPLLDASLAIACAEHTSMQARQPTCSLRLCAQSFWRYWKNFGLSKVPISSRSFSAASTSPSGVGACR
jgi:hypothetical protein